MHVAFIKNMRHDSKYTLQLGLAVSVAYLWTLQHQASKREDIRYLAFCTDAGYLTRFLICLTIQILLTLRRGTSSELD